jgi:hypothetical protein
MGRSGNSKQVLLGTSNFTLVKATMSDKNSLANNDNVKGVLVPDMVSDYQLGVNIYWQNSREEILKAFAYRDDKDKNIIQKFLEDIDNYNNLFSWASDMDFDEDLKLFFPGEKIEEMPKSSNHALFLSTVVDFRIDPLDYSRFVTLESDIKEILLSSKDTQEKLREIKSIYGHKYLIHVLGRYATRPLEGDPLKLAFRKNI